MSCHESICTRCDRWSQPLHPAFSGARLTPAATWLLCPFKSFKTQFTHGQRGFTTLPPWRKLYQLMPCYQKYIFTTLPTPELCPAAIPNQTIPNKNSLLTQIKLLSLTYVTSTFHLLKTRPPKNHQKLNGGVLSHRNTPISSNFSSTFGIFQLPSSYWGALNSAEPRSWSPPSAAWLAASVLVAPPGWGWQRNRRCPTGNAKALSFREIPSHWAFKGEHDGIHHKIAWIYIEIYINEYTV